MSSIVESAQRWAQGDCDPQTREELEALIAAGAETELAELVGADLAFGTAGLRAKVGPGSLRMNRAVIRRTTLAVAEELLATNPDARTAPVVVGYDGRLTSRQFAEDTVGVLLAAGLPVRYFEEPVPTPLVAYALRGCAGTAAIVITASHNPPEYNGYKLYAPNGAQIISPKDQQIADRISRMGGASEVKCLSWEEVLANGQASPVPTAIVDRYFHDIGGLRPQAEAPCRDIGVVYTPMHGVGLKSVRRAFVEAGFTGLKPVPSQAEPDGHFPTVSFPNPEEKGALDQALALAKQSGAELILANDPDADRLAACVKNSAGEYRQLTGNQLGLLLADYQLSRYVDKEGPSAAPPLVVSSIVSSPMLGNIAEAYGAAYDVTLTGFKWVWNAALDLKEQRGLEFVFGFEEALGYSAGDIVRDKDGVSAALLFAELAASLKAAGSGVLTRLEELYARHGLWVSVQKSITMDGAQGQRQIAAAMGQLADSPPKTVGEFAVTELRDFRTGEEQRPRWLENSNLLEFVLGDAGRVLARPSGTEPKIKFYVDLRQPLSPGLDVWEQERQVLSLAEQLGGELAKAAGL